MKKPYAIIIMDGYGNNPDTNGNAIFTDGSKYVNELKKNYPCAEEGGGIVLFEFVDVLTAVRQNSVSLFVGIDAVAVHNDDSVRFFHCVTSMSGFVL